MTGLNPFSIDKDSENFSRSLRKLYKDTSKRDQKVLVDQLKDILEGLIDEPRPTNSRLEPIPGKVTLPPLHEFRKLDFSIAKGASGQIRLMYLVNLDSQVITALWIYSHEQFSKRPADKDISKVINNAFEAE